MDSDLISRKALEDDLGKVWGIPADWDGGMDEKCETAFTVIGNQPTVDAAPVVHGRWSMVKVGETIALAKCSACGRKMNPSQYGYAYCGLCGAKMDGGDKA